MSMSQPADDPRPIAITASGPVQGSVLCPGVAHWRAVPCRAEPTCTADLFSPPRPPSPWEEPLDCSSSRMGTDATISITAPNAAASAVGARADGARAEGAPDESAAGGNRPGPYPVVVFVHGGSFAEGHGDAPWYRGEAFARSGCVLVTVNYRKRFEGFLPLSGESVPGGLAVSSPEDAREGHPYFRGAEDVVFALQWVRDNIAAFGGDPANVTAMGQSAGAALVLWTLCDPRGADLVDRCVVMSPGFPRTSWSRRARCAEGFLGGPLTVDHLSTLPEAQLLQAYVRFARMFPSDCAVGPYPFDPAKLADVPLLIGTMQGEFVGIGVTDRIDRLSSSSRALPRTLGKAITRAGLSVLGVPPERSQREGWFEAVRAEPVPRPLGRAASDLTIRQWAISALESRASQGRTWAYEFYGGAGDSRARGTDAQHCGDLPLVFDCLSVGPVSVKLFCGPNAPKRLQPLADRFHSLVVDFAHGIAPDWPEYSPTSERLAKQFDMNTCAEQVVKDGFAPVRRFFPRPYPPG
ncbi:carboxylesterase family protein [Corynebacterium heidelbergense]|uniref:Carboxylesterase/lipase family protein n=1 Tax=Corynebacterium heidelbergense TaxID=2055947 RepID=A0A364V903_9CORY|nr:carboxylesterase family protein [Corynebacterium heidelbergense]RAV33094.1 carboxylesterase/lipase family protein [Corynebacterium heidelbergense]